MFKISFYFLLNLCFFSSLALASGLKSGPNVGGQNYSTQSAFLELEKLFFKGDSNFSFNINAINWFSGRCFVSHSNQPQASLLFLLPANFYSTDPDRGPLFPGKSHMWMLGADKKNANEFDNITEKKEQEIIQVLGQAPVPQVEKFSKALVSRWANKGTGIALRTTGDYLVVRKFFLYNNFVSEYCYYFKKVK